MADKPVTKPAADIVTTDFTAFLREVNKGTALAECSAGLEEVVRAVRHTGGKGELILRLRIRPAGASGMTNDVEQVFITDEVTTKIPKHKRKDSLFFAKPDNTLTRNNPNQMDMFEKK